MSALIFWVIFLVVVAAVVMMGVKTVPQGNNYVVERLGRYSRTLEPGLSIIVPFIDSVRAQVSMMETVFDVPSQNVITRDNATVRADGVLYFQCINASAATYEVANLRVALLNLTMTNIRTVIGGMDLDELLSQRDRINTQLLTTVDKATSGWGVKVTRIELLNIDPPHDMTESMSRQLKAERDRRATILAAEGDKQAAILRAEGELAAAKMQAEARERLAEAEAKATTMVSEAVANGDTRALQYFIAQKYIESMTALAQSPNQKTLILPIEATGPLGALAGIAELLNDKRGKGDGQNYRHNMPNG